MSIWPKIVAFLFTGVVSAQTVPLQLLDNYFDSLEFHDAGFGMASVYQADDCLYSTQFGKSLLDPLEFPKKSTRYPLGASTKLLLAATVLKLADEGMLNLNKPLVDFFPGQKWTQERTVKDALLHQTGLPEISSTLDDSWWTAPHNLSDFLALIQPTDLTGANIYRYSNLNYLLLAQVLQELTEKTLDDVIESTILKPLNLRKTYLGPNTKYENKTAEGYVYDSLWVRGTNMNDKACLGSFGAYGNANDIGKLISAIRNDGFLTEANAFLFLNTKIYPGQTAFDREFDLVPLNADPLDQQSGHVTHVVYISEKDMTFILVLNGINRSPVKIIKEIHDLLDGFTYPIAAGFFNKE